MNTKILIELYRWIYFKACCIRYPLKKKILFMSFNGKQYSDNPRAICEKMHELYPEYTLVWYMTTICDEDGYVPDYVKIVSGRWTSFLRELATSCVFVTNTQMGDGIFKRKGQFFIQTWHGDVGFKKVLYDTKFFTDKSFKIFDSKYADLCIAGSSFGVQQYRSAFHYKGEVLNIGTPRNDKLIISGEDEINKIYNKLGIERKRKILIFAPTFRDNLNMKQDMLVDLKRAISVLEECGEEWICLIRAHVNSVGLNFQCDGKKFIDVSTYPDMADIMAIGDLLITDYSSCAGDFIRAGKGAILALFDKEEYTTNYREIPFDIKEAGFITAETQEELDVILRTKSRSDYRENSEKLCSYFDIVESGKSAEEICHRMDSFFKTTVKESNWF